MARRLSGRRDVPTTFAAVQAAGLTMPDVAATTNWAGKPVLKAGGSFMAGLASHKSAEPGTLVIRCDVEDRERFIEEEPDAYYLTDYYRPYPLILIRLARVDRAALQELLATSRRMALEKVRRPARRRT